MGENNIIFEKDGTQISNMTISKLRKFIQLHKSEIDKNILHRLEICLRAVENTTDAAHLLDSNIEHSLLLEIFTDAGVGLKITLDP